MTIEQLYTWLWRKTELIASNISFKLVKLTWSVRRGEVNLNIIFQNDSLLRIGLHILYYELAYVTFICHSRKVKFVGNLKPSFVNIISIPLTISTKILFLNLNFKIFSRKFKIEFTNIFLLPN